MKKQRPAYSAEFKKESAELVIDKQYSIQEAAEAVGVGPTALRRWVNQLQDENGGSTPLAKAITPEHIRIQELEAKIKQIEWEKDILKKATALLMQDTIKR